MSGLARIRRLPKARDRATRWDVYRDKSGAPVTITEEQMYAIWHAVNVVDAVRRAEGVNELHEDAGFATNAYKSRLLGRMLVRGRPPLDAKPPYAWGACDYAAVDPDWEGVLPSQDEHRPSKIIKTLHAELAAALENERRYRIALHNALRSTSPAPSQDEEQ